MAINEGRWTVQLDGDFVVFMIGAKVHDPAVGAQVTDLLVSMVDMLGELEQDPSIGLLGYHVYGADDGVIVQYWRSFAALEAYAKNPEAKHAPVWRAWNRLGAGEVAGAAIWHETYLVPAGGYEAIYQNMPLTGLQKAGTPVTVTEAKATARERLGVSQRTIT